MRNPRIESRESYLCSFHIELPIDRAKFTWEAIKLTMQVATEGPNRMSRAQSYHFWQNATAWVRTVLGKV